ncbi:MAG TPA: branched-chain amino acid ABC transporter permease [Stellaceae bacterium]|jgi:ABC-type branched-subunit amino acid transport system permease subunit|nr:branched-chain amino acid ABC transporter permease [Stellaceae bacterium]
MKQPLVAAAVLVLAALPPALGSNYLTGVALSGLVFTVAAAALNLVYGYAGLLSFAQLGFWGIGGYCSALTVTRLGGSFWDGLLVAALVNAAVAAAVGLPTLRTGRHAFVIITLSFALLCGLVARDWVSLTRGPLGIPGLPSPSLFGFAFATPARFYYLVLAFAVLALGFLYALGTSRIGDTLRAIKQNEPLAQSQGVSPLPYKLAAFVIGAILTGLAGAIYVFYLKVVDPLFLDFYYMQTFLIVVIIGGAGSFWGVVLAGLVMVALPEALRFSNDLRMVIYGAILVAAMLLLPRGAAGWFADRRLAALRARLQ